MSLASKYYVGGDPIPDATGLYSENGTYGGKACFECDGGAWWLWYWVGTWWITDAPGSYSGGWEKSGDDPAGVYNPYPTVEGHPIVSAYDPAEGMAALQAMAVPTVGRPVRSPGGAFHQVDPSLLSDPPPVTVDMWFRPMAEPVPPTPPRPFGGGIHQVEPTLLSDPPPVTVDKWFRPMAEPVPPTPIHPAGFAVWPVEDVVHPIPFVGDWFVETSLPVWPVRVLHVLPPLVDSAGVALERFYATIRGLYRVFNPAVYRFYWDVSPPSEGDSPSATSSTLPYTTGDTFTGTGTWYFSASWFNGVIDSGFLPVGPNGETYLRLDLVSDAEVGQPPQPPNDWRLEATAGAVVRIWGLYFETSDDRAEQWAIAYTTDGSTPATDSPDISQEMPTSGLAVLQYDLPAVANATTVKVRLQTRRNDGTDESPDWVYSESSTVKTITADAAGPTEPVDAETWRGPLPPDA